MDSRSLEARSVQASCCSRTTFPEEGKLPELEIDTTTIGGCTTTSSSVGSTCTPSSGNPPPTPHRSTSSLLWKGAAEPSTLGEDGRRTMIAQCGVFPCGLGGGGGGAAAEAAAAHSCGSGGAMMCCPPHQPSSCSNGGIGHPHHLHVGGVTDDALRHFADAMALIEPNAREAYEVAVKRCPAAVFEHECCPCYFLVSCNSNPWAAAVRMCSYWKERIHLFEDRAFEPITLGSDVAPPSGLTIDDMKVLETGAVMLLPSDRDGRTVLFLDHSRLEPHMIEQYKSRLRVIWYMFQAGYRSGEPQAHRTATVVSMTRPPPGGKFSNGVWQYGSGALRVAGSALPIVVDAIHLLTLPVKFGTGRIVQIGLSICASMLGSFFSTVTKVHHGTATGKGSTPGCGGMELVLGDDGSAKASLLQQLKPYGFSKRGIPEVAGGLFTDDSFKCWLKRQRRIEKRVIWTDDQRARQKRDVNRLHSQQKRQRRRQEHEELQEQVDMYVEANKQARLECVRLETLLGAAREMVGRIAPAHLEGGQARSSSVRSYSGGPCGQDGTAAEAQEYDGSMSLSLLAALEPDPIAPSCLPNQRVHPSTPAFDASAYQALERWYSCQFPSDHPSAHYASEDHEPVAMSQPSNVPTDPMAPESRYRFPFPSPSDGLSDLLTLHKNTIPEARGASSARVFQFGSLEDEEAAQTVGGISIGSGFVQSETRSGPLQFQRQYKHRPPANLARRLDSTVVDFPDTHQSLVPSDAPTFFGAPTTAAGLTPPAYQSPPLGSHDLAGARPPLDLDSAALMDHFRHMNEQRVPTSGPSIAGSHSLPSNASYSMGKRVPPSALTLWPVDVLKDLNLEYSMDPSPLVDDNIFQDTLC